MFCCAHFQKLLDVIQRNVKAIILAGGHGTRLKPLTNFTPKCLLPVDGKPPLDRIVEQFDNPLISTNSKNADSISQHLKNKGLEQADIFVEDHHQDSEKPGMIAGIKKAIDSLPTDEDVLIVGGDNIYGLDLAGFADSAGGKNAITVACYDVKDTETASNYGVVDQEQGNVKSVDEKPDQPSSTLVSTALYYIPSEEAHALSEYEEFCSQHPDSKYNMDEMGRFLEWTSDRRELLCQSFDSYWFDIGTPEEYINANINLSGGTSYISDAALVEESEVQESVVLGNARIKDSHVEKSIVWKNAKVQGSNVENCYVSNDSGIKSFS